MQNVWQEILSCYLYLLWLNNHFGKEKTLNYTDCTWNPCKLEYEVLMYPKQNALSKLKIPIQMQEIPVRLYRTAKMVKIPVLYWESLNGWQVCICDLLLINYNIKINGS